MRHLATFIEQASASHHHLCPRQVLGIRIGMAAGKLLDLDLPQTDKRLYCFVETDGCFADGVSVATGCWLGHRTLRLMDYGKVAATFVDTQTEQAFRIRPHPLARERASVMFPNAHNHWQAQLEAYQNMSDAKLLIVEAVHLCVSVTALISRPGVRVTCDHCGEEILNEREVIIGSDVLCPSCAHGGYYEVAVPKLFSIQHA